MQGQEPNAEQFRYWNEEVGPTWVAHQERFDALVARPGELAMERAAPRAGERVLDVGCGCGATALELARRVGPRGSVLGFDISAPMLARARERASAAGLGRVTFQLGDAQTFSFPAGEMDLIFSRFGVMFFADPVAAFENLRRALCRGGRAGFVCWRALAENRWVRVPMEALAGLLPPAAPVPPDAPGPFAFGDGERLRAILERAGFDAIEIEPVDLELVIPGATTREAADFLLQMGPTGRAVREAGLRDLEPLARALESALAPHAGPGGVRLPGAVWIVGARA